MNVSLEYKGDKVFKANTSKSYYTLDIKDITPVEYFATSTIACTGIDLVIMSENDGYTIKDYKVSAQTIRSTSVPMKFESFHITYMVNADFPKGKAQEYIVSSLTKYSTTINTIRGTVDIRYSIILNGIKIINEKSL